MCSSESRNVGEVAVNRGNDKTEREPHFRENTADRGKWVGGRGKEIKQD